MTACTPITFGCSGGDELRAWMVWEKDGIVTGGPYGSKNVSELKYTFSTVKLTRLLLLLLGS